MSDDIAIKVENLSKCYHIYDQPRDRLKQMVIPRLQRAAGAASKQYFREYWALKEVSFEVGKGETVGIIGRNGSGKSTLLQIICGTLSQTSGSVTAHGRIAALLELGSGFNPEFTGRENIYMNAAVLGLSNDEIEARFDDVVSFADIGDFIEQPVKSYSSGMIVRLAFAVAINVAPEILMVDEALAVGDELFQRKCFAKINSLKNEGTTILFVSHSSAQVLQICDKAILFEAGQLISHGHPKSVIGLYQKILNSPIDKKNSAIAFEETTEGLNGASDGLSSLIFESKESYDPGLTPSSKQSYEHNGALIEDAEIQTEEGVLVNHLISGNRYKYKLGVRFLCDVKNIKFGMSINATSGLFLAGLITSVEEIAGKSFCSAVAGEVRVVEFRFECNLGPDIYFINSGVYGVIDKEEVLLHRVVDILAFRVVHGLEKAGGPVWLNLKASGLGRSV